MREGGSVREQNTCQDSDTRGTPVPRLDREEDTDVFVDPCQAPRTLYSYLFCLWRRENLECKNTLFCILHRGNKHSYNNCVSFLFTVVHNLPLFTIPFFNFLSSLPLILSFSTQRQNLS